jgi:glyoxylase-like metal-dependent hydrolase (beta-lactamase superfamily II)
MRLEDHIYLIDLEPGGLRSFIASYVVKGKHAIIVETGPTSTVPDLLAGLERIDVKLEDVMYVAVSHVHLDHGGGVGTLVRNLPNAKVVVHPTGAPHLVNPQKLWQQSTEVLGKRITDLYHEPEPVPAERIIDVADGIALDVGNNVKLEVIETLGHASHHQSYYETLGGGLFPGDAAGIYLENSDVVVPTIPPPFRLDEAISSLEKLVSFNPSVLYYTHFGRAFAAVERLRAYEDQLKLWVTIAEQGIRNGQDFEAVRNKIVESDPSVRKALRIVKAHPVLSEVTINHSVMGAIKYAEKYGGSGVK